jgi:hypothetical protein
MSELQTSVKQDDTTRTRTPKPRYLNLSNVVIFVPGSCEHVDNFNFHSGLTSSQSHVNGD